jgi:hypothetical protein
LIPKDNFKKRTVLMLMGAGQMQLPRAVDAAAARVCALHEET